MNELTRLKAQNRGRRNPLDINFCSPAFSVAKPGARVAGLKKFNLVLVMFQLHLSSIDFIFEFETQMKSSPDATYSDPIEFFK